MNPTILTLTDFLNAYPQFGGFAPDLIGVALGQASSEYRTDLPNWTQITLALTAHILTMNSMGMSDSVEMMMRANGQGTKSQVNPTNQPTSLGMTRYGQEVQRMLVPESFGILWVG